MKIFNLTQHVETLEQAEAGVLTRTTLQAMQVTELLTFTTPPTKETIQERAEKLAELVESWSIAAINAAHDLYVRDYVRDEEWIPPVSYFAGDYVDVMIGGAPYLMSALEKALEKKGFTPLYAYSERVSEEQTLPCGGVKKVNVFKHICFI